MNYLWMTKMFSTKGSTNCIPRNRKLTQELLFCTWNMQQCLLLFQYSSEPKIFYLLFFSSTLTPSRPEYFLYWHRKALESRWCFWNGWYSGEKVLFHSSCLYVFRGENCTSSFKGNDKVGPLKTPRSLPETRWRALLPTYTGSHVAWGHPCIGENEKALPLI